MKYKLDMYANIEIEIDEACKLKAEIDEILEEHIIEPKSIAKYNQLNIFKEKIDSFVRCYSNNASIFVQYED